jgi:hypothetical protein
MFDTAEGTVFFYQQDRTRHAALAGKSGGMLQAVLLLRLTL